MEKKRHIANQKTNNLWNCVLWIGHQSINIVIEMPIAENSIRYRADINRNWSYRRALKKQDIRNNGTVGHYMKKWDCPGKNGMNGSPTLVGRQRTMFCWNFQQPNMMMYSVFKKNKYISETRWFCQKCCVPLYPWKCDTKYHNLTVYWNTSRRYVQSFRFLCVIVYEQSVSGFFWSMNALKVPWHLKTLGWAIKLNCPLWSW
jgi:hypothetical protein